MSKRKRALVLTAIILGPLLALWLLLARNCPTAGIALTANARNLHRLKNRTSIPKDTDFDARVNLNDILQAGDDSRRWSTERAARIQGEVIDVAYARPEATNCFSLCRRDIHILISTRKGAVRNEQMVLEVTPGFQESMTGWSQEKLHSMLVGHWCEFEGWLYFDEGHVDQAENTAPRNPTNWRATAWELHPVTNITVIR
jgi:hypothetical protein